MDKANNLGSVGWVMCTSSGTCLEATLHQVGNIIDPSLLEALALKGAVQASLLYDLRSVIFKEDAQIIINRTTTPFDNIKETHMIIADVTRLSRFFDKCYFIDVN